jgi:peptidoglycan hydrolase-like protein with peptidoglycan-binding domain
MKKIFITLSLLSLATTANASIDINLKYSQKNTEVFELQEFLVDKGYLTTSPSSFFGLMTLRAVKAYQLGVGLPSTGYVGSMTREKINASLSEDVSSSVDAEIAETGTTTPVAVKVAQVDVCPNIEGTQSVVPGGMYMDTVKGCFVPEVQTPQPVYVYVPAQPTPTIPQVQAPVVVPPQYVQVDMTSKLKPLFDMSFDSNQLVFMITSYPSYNDKVIYTFRGTKSERVLKDNNNDFQGNMNSKDPRMYFVVANDLTPDTEYEYTVRIERANDNVINYSEKTGTFRTLKAQ